MAVEIIVPALGESVSDATVARWIKTTGDNVAADEPVVELETDKVTLEVPAPAAGQIGDIVAEEGAVVEVGAILARLEKGDDSATSKSEKSKVKTFAEKPVEQPAEQSVVRDAVAPRAPAAAASHDHLSPSVRRRLQAATAALLASRCWCYARAHPRRCTRCSPCRRAIIGSLTVTTPPRVIAS